MDNEFILVQYFRSIITNQHQLFHYNLIHRKTVVYPVLKIPFRRNHKTKRLNTFIWLQQGLGRIGLYSWIMFHNKQIAGRDRDQWPRSTELDRVHYSIKIINIFHIYNNKKTTCVKHTRTHKNYHINTQRNHLFSSFMIKVQ